MSSVVERRLAHWTEVVGDWLLRPSTSFPRSVIVDELFETFQTHVSWNWMDADGSFGFVLRTPIQGWPTPEEVEYWGREGMQRHPLIRWFATSGDTAAMTIGRVPRQVAPEWCSASVREVLRPAGVEQQMSIPYRLGPLEHRAFILASSGEDFSDEDLEVARRVQPLLTLLARQASVLGHGQNQDVTASVTGRERAILQLLSEGRTAEAIAHRLLISPRTVHKHLQNLYRKLGVSDRLRAVMVAQEAGILAPHATGDGPDSDRPRRPGDGIVIWQADLSPAP